MGLLVKLLCHVTCLTLLSPFFLAAPPAESAEPPLPFAPDLVELEDLLNAFPGETGVEPPRYLLDPAYTFPEQRKRAELAFIPGISPDSYIDVENTTATVDTNTYAEGGQHTIVGEPSPAKEGFTKTWDTESEFEDSTNNNVLIDGDNVCIETTEDISIIDSFSTIVGWTVVTTDLSSLPSDLQADSGTYIDPPASGKLVVGDEEVEVVLSFSKSLDAQNWSDFNFIT